jgi:hypothetical protein
MITITLQFNINATVNIKELDCKGIITSINICRDSSVLYTVRYFTYAEAKYVDFLPEELEDVGSN